MRKVSKVLPRALTHLLPLCSLPAHNPQSYKPLHSPNSLFFVLCFKCSFLSRREKSGVFPGGPVLKNPLCNAGDPGSISDQGTKIPHAAGQLNPHTITTESHNKEPLSHKDPGQPKKKKRREWSDWRTQSRGTQYSV